MIPTERPWYAERVPLGRSGVTVSRIGLGTAPLGGLYSAVGGRQAAGTLDAAWRAGIRYFDTAPHYGAGLAEQRLGAFLTGAGRPRAECTVSTKVGRLLVPGASAPGDEAFHGDPGLVRVRDYSAEGVYRSLAESLERCGLDAFDVVLIHDPDEHWEEAVTGAYPALARLRDEGAVRAIGAGMNQTGILTRFVTETDLDCVLVAGRYSLLDHSAADELLPACADRGVGVLVGGVFNSGILANLAPDAMYDYAPAPQEVLHHALALGERCAEYGVPLAAAALRFPLRHPAVTGVVVGARSAQEVTVNVAHTSATIPEELWAELDALERDRR
ncbi:MULTISPECIES: aldo/keto reductase [unclassified Streptomyces]|uniref:aldo/keto reductase n=1 Tax=unclassified Streptomyces TaxID=2593676 RepID=UPI000477383F|nr:MULTISPECIES: aldo/keto reductase [unclassified Streptomyces]MYX32915.1 aldo/keto reductase [Streptomyces sp. SID8377]